MDVSYLIQVLQKKEIILSNAKANAFSVGDLDGINTVDKELLETQSTLAQLQLLADVTHAAAANNSSAAVLLASSIDSLQNTVQGPSASAIINGYDISSYATDPLYEQKIWSILGAMPTFEHIEDVDAYIQATAPGSPVTAEMIKSAVATYNADTQLLIAIMQNDSQFGTQGIATTTNNPGNVGNTGYATQTYGSWADGVLAVAEWLSRHKVVADVPVPVEVQPVATTTIKELPIIPAPTLPVASTTDTGIASTTPPTPFDIGTTTATSTEETATTTP